MAGPLKTVTERAKQPRHRDKSNTITHVAVLEG